MKNRKVFALVLAVAVCIAMLPSMAFAEDAVVSAPEDTRTNDIVILTTNDVHCGIDNTIGYAGLAAYKKQMAAENKYVAMVDAGDAIQGGTIGTLSKGTYLVDIMNEVGYDIAVPGNHEFDYGMDQFLGTIVKNSNATYLSANFVDAKGNPVFDSYKILTYGDKKVAFVGVSTPETFFKSTPTFFQDANGNYIYGFCEGNDGKDLYAAVQKAVDAAKTAGADYVVAVGHVGIDESSAPWRSTDIIKNTNGIDVFVDGHSHSTFASVEKNKDGKAVQTVSTGTQLENIGKVVIKANGTINASLVTAEEATAKDAATETFVNDIKAKYAKLEAKVVAKSSVDLITHDADGNRLVRSQETNLGDLCADAYRACLGTDIAFVNGGGVRAPIAKGDVTYGHIISVHPFGNMACSVEATGQQILDALEFGSKDVGVGENGGFLQVSGLTYSINTFIKPSIEMNDKGEFVAVNGDYRVGNVVVNGKPLDLEKTYTLASHNYMLKQGGDGFVMFKGNKILQDEVLVDNQVLINYIQKDLKGVIGAEYAAPQNRINVVSFEAFDILSQKLAVSEYECKASVKSTKLSGKRALKVSWNAAKVAGVKYQVWKSTKATSGFKKAITTAKTSYTTTKVKKGTKYYFKVRAFKTIDGKVYFGHYSNKVNKVA